MQLRAVWRGFARAGVFFGLLALVAGGCKGSSGGGATGVVVGPLSTPQMSVAAGEVTESSALLWANPQGAGDVTFDVFATSTLTGTPFATATVSTSSALIPAKVAFSGLTAATRYYYRATAGTEIVSGQFKTLPTTTATSTGLVFGVSGDWRGELAPYPSVGNVPDQNLDFFVSLGDNIYSDTSSPIQPDKPAADQPFRGVGASTLEEYRLKHREVFSERYGLNTLADLRASTAWFATIDDHEFFDNVAGGAPAGSDPRFVTTTGDVFNSDTAQWANGMQSFLDYHPVDAASTYSNTSGTDALIKGRTKLYRTWRYGEDAAFFLLDLRSFRSQEVPEVEHMSSSTEVGAFLGASASPGRSMLGAQQLADLKADLAQAQKDEVTWKFILSSVPISSLGPFAYGQDRWDGYLRDRAQLLAFINKQSFLTGLDLTGDVTSTGGIDNVVFISADVHGSVVSNLSYTPLNSLFAFLLQTPASPVPFPFPKAVTGTWEITTGPVGFDPGLGESAVAIAAGQGLLPPTTKALYDALPFGTQKDQIVQGLLDALTDGLHVDRIGLDRYIFTSTTTDPLTNAATSTEVGIEFNPTQWHETLNPNGDIVIGDPTISVHHQGWTQFEIATDGMLTITTWGIEPYSTAELIADPIGITSRTPRVIQKFRVHAHKP